MLKGKWAWRERLVLPSFSRERQKGGTSGPLHLGGDLRGSARLTGSLGNSKLIAQPEKKARNPNSQEVPPLIEVGNLLSPSRAWNTRYVCVCVCSCLCVWPRSVEKAWICLASLKCQALNISTQTRKPWRGRVGEGPDHERLV